MIGIFDSGMGGLSVLAELRKRAPNVDVVYVADNKHLPFGSRPQAELGALTALGFEKLLHAGAKHIIAACNSVSVLLMDSMFDILSVRQSDVIDMARPTIEYCADRGFQRVLIVATEATIASQAYQRGLEASGITVVGQALPGFVPLIESGASTDAITAYLQQSNLAVDGVDAVILGCTHFPLALESFRTVLGEQTVCIDPAVPVVEAVLTQWEVTGTGTLHIILSAPSKQFTAALERMLPDSPYTITIT